MILGARRSWRFSSNGSKACRERSRRVQATFAQPGVSGLAHKGTRLAEVAGPRLARNSRMEKIMTANAADAAVERKCKLEVRPEIWDLSGEMYATFSVAGGPPNGLALGT